MYRCRTQVHRRCLPQQQRCDGFYDCPMGDDEWFCHFDCPSMCECRAHDVNCSNQKLKVVPALSSQVSSLVLSGNSDLHLAADAFKDLIYLGLLDLSHCGLQSLPAYIFKSQGNLKMLDISHNKLSSIGTEALGDLTSLTHFYFFKQ